MAGSFKYAFYDEACAHALEKLGNDVVRFSWQKYYGTGLLSKMQQRWLIGPGIVRLNQDLVRAVSHSFPDVVFITRGVPIWPSSLSRIKKHTRALLVSNNNDDPFGGERGKCLWSHFVKAIPLYDLHFVFRAANVPEYLQCGAKRAEVLMPYYVPKLHYPIALDQQEITQYSCEVAFVGHAKRDSRLTYLEPLARSGVDLRLYGWYWDRLSNEYPWLEGRYFPPVWDLDYTRAIRATKVALVFFTEKNRDTYTCRTFEIPAIGTCMVSERTEDMQRLFREDIEAVYFSSPDELVEKVRWLLSDDDARNMLREKAQERLNNLGASVDDRMSEALLAIQACMTR